MKFGISLQGHGATATPDHLAQAAQQAEKLGFDTAFMGDHIVTPVKFASQYPGTSTGSIPASWGEGDWLEPLAVLGFLAAKTQRIRLAPSVMIVPHRNPLVAAKVLATVDVLSKGRLTVGVGVGWLKEEFVALGLPPFEERGAVSNEYIRAFKELWTRDSPSFKGRYCSFSGIRFEPKPVQKPHPPIWVGGESPAAMKRAVTLCDGWHPLSSNPTYPLATAEQLKAAVDRLGSYAKKAGRDPSEIDVAYRVQRYRLTNEGHAAPFVGRADHIAEDVRAFAAAGAKHLVFDFHSNDPKEMLSLMEEFALEIMPRVR